MRCPGLAYVATLSGVLLAAPAFAQGDATSSAPAGPSAETMADLAPNHWAYNAIKLLMERYRVMGGFPDKTFRGEKGVSRYELAAALVQIMDKLDAKGSERVAPSDRDLVDKLRKEFTSEIGQVSAIRTQTQELGKKVITLETDVKDLKGWKDGFQMPKIVDKVKGRVDVSLMDDPEDKLFPYWTTSAQISVSGKVSDSVSTSFSLSGGQAARQISVSPAIAGADKPPSSALTLGGNAALSAKFPGDLNWTTQFGYFKLSGLMGMRGYAGHWWDGIIGSGLAEPSANPSRSGARDMALGTKLTWGGLGVAAGVSSQIAAAYTGWDFGFGNINLVADTDHDSVNLERVLAAKNRDRPYAMATSLNLGSEQLGLVLRGGVKGTGNFFTEGAYQPFAAVQTVFNIGGVEIAAGTDFKMGTEKTSPTQQIRPAAYVFVPALHPQLPTILFGVVDVETLQGGGGKPGGPGSLLGDKSGMTLQFGYDNPILPNLTIEADYQQDVLFSDKYDGWGYAVSTGVEF
ncbi:MAG: S-layer homology domain-containing protein [Candidatus Sericytochromatia bacterium]|nr:S-layer homology domain-containing protein [Candidatus Tanganyikabacteria bacterium]